MNKHALALVVAAAPPYRLQQSTPRAPILQSGFRNPSTGSRGAITTVVSNVANVAVFAGSFGGVGNNDFQLLATGVGSPPLSLPALFNTNLNVVANAGGVSTVGNVIALNVYLTEFNNNAAAW